MTKTKPRKSRMVVLKRMKKRKQNLNVHREVNDEKKKKTSDDEDEGAK